MFTSAFDPDFIAVRNTAYIAAKRMQQDYLPVFSVAYLEGDYKRVPDTGRKIYDRFLSALNDGEKMPILATPADCQCFLFRDGNDIYRTVHDYDHFLAYPLGKGTTSLANESALNLKMVRRLLDYAKVDIKDTGILYSMELCLLADLVGQSYYYAQNKAFINNKKQLDFVVWLVGQLDWLGIDANGPHYDKWLSIVFPDFS